MNLSKFKPEEVTAIELFKTQYTGTDEELEPVLEYFISRIIDCSKAIQKGYAYFFIAAVGERNNDFMSFIHNNGFMVKTTKDKFINRVWIISRLNNTNI